MAQRFPADTSELTVLASDDKFLVSDTSDSAEGKELDAKGLYIPVPYDDSANGGRVHAVNTDVNSVDSVAHTGAIIAGGQATRAIEIGSTTHGTFGWYDADAVRWTDPRYEEGVGRHINSSGPNHNYIIGYDNCINGDSNQIHGHHSLISADVDHSQIIGSSWHQIHGTVEGEPLSYCWIGGSGSPGNGIGGRSSRSTILGGVNTGIYSTVEGRTNSAAISTIASFIDSQDSVVLGGRASVINGGVNAAVVGGQGFYLGTTTAAAEPQGETEIAVTSTAGVAVGDRVMIRYSGGNSVLESGGQGFMHWTTVASILTTPTRITIDDALPAASYSGAEVHFVGGHGCGVNPLSVGSCANSVVLGGIRNQANSTSCVAMGEQSLANSRSGMFLGGGQFAAPGDAQAYSIVHKTTTTGNDTSENLLLAGSASLDRMNYYGLNVAISGTVHLLAVATTDGTGGAAAAGSVSSWKIPFTFVTAGSTIGATSGWTGTVSVGTVEEVSNGLAIANNPSITTNTSAALRVNVNSTPDTGTSGGIRWIARWDCVMTHF